MGYPITEFHATNVGDKSGWIILSKFKPEKRDNGKWYPPKDTQIGYDLWIPNVIDLKEEEGVVDVDIVKSDEETGLWLICYDDYFGDEQHLYTNKPRFIEGTKKMDYEFQESYDNFELGLYIWAKTIDMKAGDGPISVTLKRI